MKIVGMLPVYEEADWLEWAVKSIVDFVDFLVIAEGYQGPPYHFWGNRSTDGTLEILNELQSRYPGKIKTINCAWGWHVNHGKAQTHNKALRTFDQHGLIEKDNWYFLVDSDEFYTTEQLSEIKEILQNTTKDLLIVHDRMFVFNFKYYFPATHGRLMRITEGMFFKPAQFACYSDGRTYVSCPKKIGYILQDKPMFHYSFVRSNERMLKRIQMEFLSGAYKQEVFEWFNEVYMKWTDENSEQIYQKNQKITDNSGIAFCGEPLRLQKYTAAHPVILDNHPYRKVNDLRRLENSYGIKAKVTLPLYGLYLLQNLGRCAKKGARKVASILPQR